MASPVQHIVSVSGGKDSTATYLLALERGVEFTGGFADTDNEHEWVYEFVDDLPRKTGGPPIKKVKADLTKQLAKHRNYILEKWPQEGIPADVVARAAALNQPSGNVYLDLCILKGRFPSRMVQFCTQELKEIPITEQIIFPALRNGPVLQWIGIRAEESLKRAKDPRYNKHDNGSWLWRPLLHWKLEDVWAIHRRHGLEPNKLYANGMGRVGCMPCINCGKNELREIATRFPEHIQRIQEWETIVADACKRSAASFFTTKMGTTGIETVVEWAKTARGGKQYQMFFDQQSGGGCSSDLALCEA
jgi:3'-phosphoadenosine 5'-phosphosulfate sulfotransferase (PAPS reductase)/FAD synthetase